MAERYIGLMSGTSLDGVDGVLLELDGRPAVLAHASAPLPPSLRAELLALNTAGGPDELHRAALAANALAGVYARVVHELLQASGVPAGQVQAIGAHGQTVRHRPGDYDGIGYTLQLNAPALLAERCGIAVAADFRTRDVAAGGQGAPLVPAFHAAVFADPAHPVTVLNVGGFANLTRLAPGLPVLGFDCGPGNALMDLWIDRHHGQAYDADGAWAARGTVHPGLLDTLLQDPYFGRPPPKSTGRDQFNAAWLDSHLARWPSVAAVDVQATLCELTAASCARAIDAQTPQGHAVRVCGGGALNGHLMRRLSALLPRCTVESTQSAGLSPLQVEAAAFAWLAQALVRHRPGNLPAVTGARGPRILGALYPA